MEQRAGIRLEGDAKGFTAAAREAEAAAAKLNTTVQANALHMERAGLSTKQYQQAMRQVAPQITDIVTQLAAGQNPMLVMIQQGGQLKDMFGGIVPAARALLGAISPMAVGVGAAGASVAALALAAKQAYDEHRALERAILDTNNAAGVTVGQMRELAKATAGRTTGSQGDATDAAALLLGGGRVGSADLQKFTDLAVRAQRTLGVEAAKTVAILTELGRDPVAASVKLNETTNHLSASVMGQIRTLKAQGKENEAASLAQNAWADQTVRNIDKIEAGLGRWEKAWRDLTKRASEWWSWGVNASAPETLQDKLKAQIALVERLEQRKRNLPGLFGRDNQQDLDEAKAAADAIQRRVFREGELESRLAADQRDRANKAKKDIEDQSAARQAALLNITKAGAEKRFEEAMRGQQELEDWTRKWYERIEVDAATANDVLIGIERRRFDEQLKRIDRLRAAEEGRKLSGETPNEKEARTAAVLQLDQRRLDVLREQKKFEVAVDRGEFPNLKPRNVIEDDPQAVLRLGEIASDPAANKAATDFWLQQRSQAIAAGKEIEATNRQLSVALIRDDAERGRAQIALEEKVLRERLALQYLSVDERKKAEDDLAEWRVLREKQLTEQLKPEWQRQVERWGDATRLMKDTFDDTISAALREGENQWIRFATTGKFSVRELGQAIEQEVARYAFKKFVSVMFNLLGNLGGVEGATGDFARMDRATVGHTGGVFGRDAMDGGRWMPSSMFAGAPRFHMGRLAFDEIPAVVKKEESILTPAQMRMLAPAGSANLVVNVINQTGQPVQATQERNANGGLDVILRTVEEGMADRLASGAGTLGRAMENRYGLRPAMV